MVQCAKYLSKYLYENQNKKLRRYITMISHTPNGERMKSMGDLLKKLFLI